ncbi:MAG TPA: SulP family inorganic anion transporter [Bryobacteraceae bacterium]|nr:SulP family inorganic anion transporter [Bryobacteraceae bacterium]
MNSETLKHDLLASVVVFLVALPLCMGIAIASGAPPAMGLVTGIIGGLVVGAMSGCPLQVSGPAAGLAVLVYEIIHKGGLQTLGPVVLLAGLMQVCAGLLRAGQFFRMISPSVIFGMLAGIGILISAAQFHVMVDDKPRENAVENLRSIPESIWKGLFPVDGSNHHLAAYVGAGTIVILILWARFAPLKLKWIPGALLAVGAATAASAVLALPIQYVQLSDNFLSALPFVNLRELSGLLTADIWLLALTVAFVASAETLLSAAAVDQMHDGPKANYNRELFSQGVGNAICGMLGALPMTGVVVRSATNVAAGAKTRTSAMLHGVWLLTLVAAVPSLLRLVPTASLAAVLVYTGYKLVNVQNVRRLLRYGGAPVLIYAATVIGIVGMDLLRGILLGLALSVAKVIYARTHFSVRLLKDENRNRIDVLLEGAATFLRLPKFADSLEAIPREYETHVHLRDLEYVDDACLEALSNWQMRRTAKGCVVVVEWGEALRLYRDKNPLGAYQRAEIEVSAATH